jgi:hypothetical protein
LREWSDAPSLDITIFISISDQPRLSSLLTAVHWPFLYTSSDLCGEVIGEIRRSAFASPIGRSSCASSSVLSFMGHPLSLSPVRLVFVSCWDLVSLRWNMHGIDPKFPATPPTCATHTQISTYTASPPPPHLSHSIHPQAFCPLLGAPSHYAILLAAVQLNPPRPASRKRQIPANQACLLRFVTHHHHQHHRPDKNPHLHPFIICTAGRDKQNFRPPIPRHARSLQSVTCEAT